jgi:hypothetical protein
LPSRDIRGRFVPEIQVDELDIDPFTDGSYLPFSYTPSPATSFFALTPAVWTPSPSPPPDPQNTPPPPLYSPPRVTAPNNKDLGGHSSSQQNNDSDDDSFEIMADIKLFMGEGTNESPQDFLRSLKRMFMLKATFDDSKKVEFFEVCLKTNSLADEWWTGLPAASRAGWDALETAFNAKWPMKAITPKTTSEKKTLLEEARLEEKDLGRKVMAAGVEEYSHVVWADKVEKLAGEIPDTGNLLVDSIREKLPKGVRKLVGTKHTTWAEFCKAVRELRPSEILEKVEEEREAARIQQQLKTLMNPPPTPSKALSTALRNISLTSNPIPRPQFMFRPPVKAAAQQATYPQRTDQERMADIQANALPIHPDTPTGRALYDTQVAVWTRAHSIKKPNEWRPYPLTPGSSPVASGECWTCGQLSHLPADCQRPAVPEQEVTWRRIAGGVGNRLRRAGASSVNVVQTVQADEAGGSRLADIIMMEHYETLLNENRALWEMIGQGNGEGSSD